MNIKKILKPVLSIVLALVLGAAVIAMVGENPDDLIHGIAGSL